MRLTRLFETDQLSAVPWRPFATLARWQTAVVLIVLFGGVTSIATYPQVLWLDAVPDPGDPFFSMWRLAWIAHQLPRNPLRLFDANIFYPERNTLAFSDSILLPGSMSAPLLWLGMRPVIVYNLAFLSAITLSGITMFLLAGSLTRDTRAALMAGLFFISYPFRLAHYPHLELQCAFGIPVVIWALHKVMATGCLRYGLMTGAAFGLQTLSCINYAVLMSAYLLPVWGTLALTGRSGWRGVRSLGAGAVLALLLVAPLVPPYLAVRADHGERRRAEVALYSAVPRDYLVAPANSATYGRWLSDGRAPERELFPGLLLVVLALAGLWPPWSPTRLALALGLLLAVDGSFGFNGILYPWLYEYLLPFRAVRVPARFGMLVGFSLCVLAGFGVVRLTAYAQRAWLKTAVVIVLGALALVEGRPELSLAPARRHPPVYDWFRGGSTGVLAEFPMSFDGMGWINATYMYFSARHWQRLVNGYSGMTPQSSLDLLEEVHGFPDDRAFAALRARAVGYVTVHEQFYGPDAYREIVEALAESGEVAELRQGGPVGYRVRLYALVPR